jgi:hypothetical protein
MIDNTIGFIAANHFRASINIIHRCQKTLLSNDKNEEEEEENKQVKIPKVLHEQVKEKEFIILKIYKSEIDKAIEDLKEHKNLTNITNLTIS